MKKLLLLTIILFGFQISYSQISITPTEKNGSIWVKVDCNAGGFCKSTEILLKWGKVNQTKIYNWTSAQLGKVGCIIELKYNGGNHLCSISSTGSNLRVVQSKTNPFEKGGYDILSWASMRNK